MFTVKIDDGLGTVTLYFRSEANLNKFAMDILAEIERIGVLKAEAK